VDLGLAGRTVFLTGGSGGLGAPLACGFAREGARVALTYLTGEAAAKEAAAQAEQAGGEAMTVRYDLTDPASITAATEAVITAWGGIDVLVLSASPAGGPNRSPVLFEEIPPPQWQAQLRAEVEGAFSTVQAVLPSMRSRGWGRIVMMSASIVERGMAGSAAYVASKAALSGLSRNLATELYGAGVLCNVVAPGPVVTGRFLRVGVPGQLRAGLAGKTPEEIKVVLNGSLPGPRISTPADVANMVVFLGSAANGNISGTVVNVNGH
jgi:NAD(P)-dependent dehydrogenase (short-subunit alcohol dehydrogenase family)